ncbi:conserved hypothetical protein [Ricinus communis]|uniref:Uncharacterized protein n=1 Tax=Ricinus communis TaxID=3988 RepID=B9RPU6_RICCO|nr:conserved hypothetical protein [Ricinus communis]
MVGSGILEMMRAAVRKDQTALLPNGTSKFKKKKREERKKKNREKEREFLLTKYHLIIALQNNHNITVVPVGMIAAGLTILQLISTNH